MAPIRGDLSGRPEEDEVYATATAEVQANEIRYSSRAILVNIGLDRQRTEPRNVANAFRREFGVRPEAMRITAHFPEDFFVLFDDVQVREDVVLRARFLSGGREFIVLPWSVDRRSEWVAAPYHVRLCIESMPDEAWTADMVERLIARRGTVHFIEGTSTRRDDTTTLNVWVWTRDPASIPRRVGFNLMNPTLDGDIGGPVQELPIFYRDTPCTALEGRRSRDVIHIDVVEDFTALGRAATASSVAARGHRSILGYGWRLGGGGSDKPESERERHSSPPTRHCSDGKRRSDRRDRDGDRDRDGHGRGWGARKESDRERHYGRSGRAEPYPVGRVSDRSSYVGGRRRSGGPIRHHGRTGRAARAPARVSRKAVPCSPAGANPAAPPSPGGGSAATVAVSGGGCTSLARDLEGELLLAVQAAPAELASPSLLLAPAGDVETAAVDPLTEMQPSFAEDRQTISAKLQKAVLDAPRDHTPSAATAAPSAVRRSARIARRPASGATMEQLAQEAVACRLGSLPPSTPFTERLLQAYLALFDGPLSGQAVEAIEQLVLAIKTKKKMPAGLAKAVAAV